MRKNCVLSASWYDYPQYYDIAFQTHTLAEADFIEAACRKYCPFEARRLLEPACGTGRLITELAVRGYKVTGFDISQPALRYLRRRLERRRLHADTFEAEMSDFRVGRSADAAYCMVNTFRHLLTEQAARSHLECIAGCLRPGGIYVLGMNLLPSVCPWHESAAIGRRPLGGKARQHESHHNRRRATHPSSPQDRRRSRLPYSAPGAEGISPPA